MRRPSRLGRPLKDAARTPLTAPLSPSRSARSRSVRARGPAESELRTADGVHSRKRGLQVVRGATQVDVDRGERRELSGQTGAGGCASAIKKGWSSPASATVPGARLVEPAPWHRPRPSGGYLDKHARMVGSRPSPVAIEPHNISVKTALYCSRENLRCGLRRYLNENAVPHARL